jgi:superfamily II DNA helicase RecQ
MFRIISIPFSNREGGFSVKELNEFVRNKRGITYQAELMKTGGIYYWSVFIYYEEEVSKKTEYEFKNDYEKLMYEELKKWRNARAEKEGIPPYIIFTNKQLKDIVKIKCESKESLKNVDGIGESKSGNYGSEVIDIVKSFLDQTNGKSDKLQ